LPYSTIDAPIEVAFASIDPNVATIKNIVAVITTISILFIFPYSP